MNSYHHRYNVIADANTPVDEVWTKVKTITAIRDDYEGQARIYNWSADQARFELSSYFAYWIARHVIMDHWPAAESLIQKDEIAWKLYTNYKEICSSLGILNHSVDGNHDFHVDGNGQIMGWKDERKPSKKSEPARNLNRIADSIAEKVAVFRKQRKLQNFLQEDNDEN